MVVEAECFHCHVMCSDHCWWLCGSEARWPFSTAVHWQGDVLVPDCWEVVQGPKNGSHHVAQVSFRLCCSKRFLIDGFIDCCWRISVIVNCGCWQWTVLFCYELQNFIKVARLLHITEENVILLCKSVICWTLLAYCVLVSAAGQTRYLVKRRTSANSFL